ncbi:MAG: PKD domain-containing protein [bacterium]
MELQPDRCVSFDVLCEYNTQDQCVETVCDDDQVCQSHRCVDASGVEFVVDFDLTVTDDTVAVEIAPDDRDPRCPDGTDTCYGFPRKLVDALRFDFGDGIAGWGESLSHTYTKPGVYPVTLNVRLKGYREYEVTKLAVINPAPDWVPFEITVNGIPQYLNGSTPAWSDNGTSDTSDDIETPFTLAVNRTNFDVDLTLLPTSEDNPILPQTLRVATLDSSDNLIDHSNRVEISDDRIFAKVHIDTENAPAAGAVLVRGEAKTKDGQLHFQELTVIARDLTPQTDPFDRPMTWLLRDDTDFFTTGRTRLAGTRYTIDTTEGVDGLADFVHELRMMGCQGDDDAINATYRRWIKDAISTEIYRIFGMGPDGTPHDGIEFKIAWIDDPNAPRPADFSMDGEFSMMRLGGTFEGYLGYSKFAAYNEDRVDDSTIEFGTATGGILSSFTSLIGISDAFKAVNPDVGVPVGADPLDSQIFSPDFDPAKANAETRTRYHALRDVANNIALALAPVIAHEMGHAMGLMPDGLPPEGFFGNRPDIGFVGPRTNSLHADLPGLNLMQAGGDSVSLIGELESVIERGNLDIIGLATVLSKETRLSPLSRAYLQRKLTYGP